MSARPIDPALLQEALAAYEKIGTIEGAAMSLNLSRNTYKYRLQRAQQLGVSPAGPEIEYPDLPADDIDPAEIIARASADFAQQKAARAARKWFEIKVKGTKPIGVVWMGDPHVDNPGTNWPLLEQHIKIIRDTEGVYSILGNDLTDNWVGRLARLYARSNMSKNRASRLARWIIAEAGLKPLAVIGGNHDLWNDGLDLFKAVAAKKVPVEAWGAKMALRFGNDRVCRLHLKHDFAGHSQWNPLHGPQKHALMGEEAHVYAAAHKHNWALYKSEHEHRNHVYWLARARGYKFFDEHAEMHGFGSQQHGASIFILVDPAAKTESGFVTCFDDVEEGAEFLKWKRR